MTVLLSDDILMHVIRFHVRDAILQFDPLSELRYH